MRKNRVRIGRILGPQGVRGELKILALTDLPERFLSMEKMRVFSDEGVFRSELTLLSARRVEHKGLIVAETEEISSRSEAEGLVGNYIEIEPEERYPLEEGEFWIDDLIGMAAVNGESGETLGTLRDVVSAGEQDIYIIRDENGKDHYIPAVREFITEVNLEKRKISIALMEGLWETCM
ncbi:MAG: ribosome maturation factor RimM [Synergistaceae bacterium]|nr:ribosome maturation factor RimM [Synergistaceae bacterium]